MFATGKGHKGLLTLGGKPIIAHVIASLIPQTNGVIINANDDEERFEQFACPIVPDINGTIDGPLAGIAASLAWAIGHRPDIKAIVTVTTDAPFIPDNLVATLAQAANGGAAIATSGGRHHPTIGLWPVALLPTAIARLAASERRMTDFARHTKAIEVAFPFGETHGVQIDPFFNLNTPEDLARAQAVWAKRTTP